MLLPNKHALGCKWVFKLKYRSAGTLERYKTRLVIFATKNWDLFQTDVHNAFLHGDLEEEVYMKPPPGFSALDKAKNRKDYSLFSYTRGPTRLHVLVYVDELSISSNDPTLTTKFKAYMSQCFHMKDLGILKYFLGIKVSRAQEGIYLSQRKYALDIISECGLTGSKPFDTPIEQNHTLGKDDGPLLDNPAQYRRLVGRLVYLIFTRPELSYVEHPTRVVQYLKGTPGHGVFLSSDSDLSLVTYCDSDYNTCPFSRRSLTGYVVSLGGSPVSWKTKKQQVVSRSSAEAVYMAMSMALCEVKWLKELLLTFGVTHSAHVAFFCDNEAALHIAANPVFHECTKHIESDCHFVRDAVQDGTISTHHVFSEEQVADFLIKALGRQQFDYLLRKMGVRDLHSPS
ncbi:PREDICTED: uncharacterized protein LOC109126808 [Camelina sativa]|uniref:Uncharacterized protein LOC109126808 n=1 Tax=Camelina sativa TaxID=90675 RepID=A0ABM1QHH7_CAMSA|nr:PREDICTED: uncharacterized protein LOC109126808 [Camelina sativa]